MAITINWATKVITVPKNFMTTIQTDPFEVRGLDLNDFRLALKDLEDNDDGMTFPDTHRHNTQVTLAGITFAHTLEIINGYTVTFEDGQYAVNATGANSNIADVMNLNQVSLRTANSAGLQVVSVGSGLSTDEHDELMSIKGGDETLETLSDQIYAIADSTAEVQLSQEEHDQIMSISDIVDRVPDMEHSTFSNGVCIDLSSPYSGTSYPVGTSRQCVNNLTDAVSIAASRGFVDLYFLSNFTFESNVNIGAYILNGQGMSRTTFTFNAGSLVLGGKLKNAKIVGAILGFAKIEDCSLENIAPICPVPRALSLIILRTLLIGTITLSPNFSGYVQVLDCWGGITATGIPILDMNHCSVNVLVRNYSGNMTIKNNTADNTISINMDGGVITLESSVTAGSFVVSGTGLVVNNSTGTTIDSSGLVSPANVANITWDTIKSIHTEEGSFGEAFEQIKTKTDQMEFHTAGGILATVDEIIEPALTQVQDAINDSTAIIQLTQEEQGQSSLINDIKDKTDQLTFTTPNKVDSTGEAVLSPEIAEQINIIGEDLKRTLGLLHENIYIDLPVYDENNNLVSARVRIYSNSGSTGTDNDVIGNYLIICDSAGLGKFTTWKQVRQ